MILTVRSPSPASGAPANALSALSRNASVISSSSSSSSSSSVNIARTPTQLRQLRTFSPPRSRQRSISPAGFTNTRVQQVLHHRASGVTIGGRSPDNAVDGAPPSPRSRGPPSSPTPSIKLLTRADFDFGETLGEGSYSEVVSATLRSTGKVYAIKVIHKLHLIKQEKVKYATLERDALAILTSGGHPGIIALYSTFQDQASLYFVLSLAPNGDLQSIVRQLGSLSLACTRHYVAQVVDTVTWMHSRGVIHRDLKPENILFDHEWRMKLTDFGSAKLLKRGDDGAFHEDPANTRSFVGSAQYVSPELLIDKYKYACKSSDLWAVGCILFQLISGQFLFHALTEYLTFDKIKRGDHAAFPPGFHEDAKDLVEKLLPLDPSERIGAYPKSSTEELKAHPFFSSVLTTLEVGGDDDSSSHPERLAPVDWASLWSIPSPPLETGLVRKAPVGPPRAAFWDEAFSHSYEQDELDQSEPDSPLVVNMARLRARSRTPPRGREGTRQMSSPLPVPDRDESLSRSSGTPSDGASSLESTGVVSASALSSISAENATVRDGLSPLLLPGERVAHCSIVQVRRDALGGLLRRKARTLVLCLTSTGRLLGVRTKGSTPWKAEMMFILSPGGETPTNGAYDVDGAPTKRKTVLGVEPKEDRQFVIRTAQRNYSVVTKDTQMCASWLHVLRESIQRT